MLDLTINLGHFLNSEVTDFHYYSSLFSSCSKTSYLNLILESTAFKFMNVCLPSGESFIATSPMKLWHLACISAGVMSVKSWLLMSTAWLSAARELWTLKCSRKGYEYEDMGFPLTSAIGELSIYLNHPNETCEIHYTGSPRLMTVMELAHHCHKSWRS